MSQATAIEWTDVSWNPVHGCSMVRASAEVGGECDNCYAAELSLRRGHTVLPWTAKNAAENVTLKPHKLREPMSNAKHWRGLGAAAAAAGKTDGKLVFVNSMSDLFHPRVPGDFIGQVFAVMERCPQHTFQVLTKRPKRMRDWTSRHRPTPLENVWLGVSIGLREKIGRADLLRETPAAVRFVSAEPLLGPLVGNALTDEQWERKLEALPIDAGLPMLGESNADYEARTKREWAGNLDLAGIDWLIVGGESGPRARPMKPEWVRDLRDACLARRAQCDTCSDGPFDFTCPACVSSTAFFFKQWGGRTSKTGGRELDGRTWDEFPSTERSPIHA